MDDEKFGALVSEAINHIPMRYQDKMKSVAIVIADEPTSEQRAELQLRGKDGLFGLYQGIPLPRRGGAVLSVPPDVITIFKHPMVDIFQDPQELKKQVYETLWHEVAHFFGLDHDDMNKVKKRKTSS